MVFYVMRADSADAAHRLRTVHGQMHMVQTGFMDEHLRLACEEVAFLQPSTFSCARRHLCRDVGCQPFEKDADASCRERGMLGFDGPLILRLHVEGEWYHGVLVQHAVTCCNLACMR